MRIFFFRSLFLYLSTAVGAYAADAARGSDNLLVPAQKLSVSLDTGVVSRNGFSDECLETVSKSKGNTLLVTKSPGDDSPTVRVNGQVRQLNPNVSDNARLGSMRLTPDGSLVHLRTWKTGEKRTEALVDGQVRLAWKRGTSVRLLRANGKFLMFLVTDKKGHSQLVRHQRGEDGFVDPVPISLLDFGSCSVKRLRLASEVLWSQMGCDAGKKTGIFRSGLGQGNGNVLLLPSSSAEFATLPKSRVEPGAVPVTIASGSPAALQFYYAVTGLLLSQTGEVRACSSDAEGFQSWNQSYRLRALALLFEKTSAGLCRSCSQVHEAHPRLSQQNKPR